MIDKEKVKDYYNNSIKILDKECITEEYKSWLDLELKNLDVMISSSAKILEIGAGDGRVIDRLENGTRKIVGIDIANISNLKKKYSGNSNVEIFEIDAESLGFEDDSFDVCIIAYNSLGLIANPKKALEECKRVVRNEGLVLITTYEMDENYCLKERIRCFKKIGHKIKVEGLDFEISEGVASHYFTKEELNNLFKKVGFEAEYVPLTKLGCLWKIEVKK